MPPDLVTDHCREDVNLEITVLILMQKNVLICSSKLLAIKVLHIYLKQKNTLKLFLSIHKCN